MGVWEWESHYWGPLEFPKRYPPSNQQLAPESRPFAPKGKDRLSSTIFQVLLLLVSGRVVNSRGNHLWKNGPNIENGICRLEHWCKLMLFFFQHPFWVMMSEYMNLGHLVFGVDSYITTIGVTSGNQLRLYRRLWFLHRFPEAIQLCRYYMVLPPCPHQPLPWIKSGP